MPGINWKTVESKDKLLAAVLASMGTQTINYGNVAKFFGENTTYYSIENQFRPIRKVAEQMKTAVTNNKPVPAAADRNTGSAAASAAATPTATPTTNRRRGGGAIGGSGSGRKRGSAARDGGVVSGRIAKAELTTPTKPSLTMNRGNSVMGMKQEVESSDEPSPAESFLNEWASGEDGIDGLNPFSFSSMASSGNGFDFGGESV